MASEGAALTIPTFIRQSQKPLYFLGRVVLGLVLVVASWNKLLDPEGFAPIVGNYNLLPQLWIRPVALVLPWIEIFCGLALISGVCVRGGALIGSLLMVVFMAALLINAIRGVDISCGCFSNSTQAAREAYLYFWRDLPLLVAGVWVCFYRFRQDAANEASRGHTHLPRGPGGVGSERQKAP
jgi:uncharacterized membrane protein YphA (DoxX/SURF4 family)